MNKLSLFLICTQLFYPLQSFSDASTITDHDWSFYDHFSGGKNHDFWLGNGHNTDYGVTDPTDPSNKVMAMTYIPNSEGSGDSWSEHDFKLPIQAVQIEMGWRMYIPPNYTPIENNHKVFALWSGTYGKANAHISVSSEAWGTPSGARPSVYVGVDGHNYGHAMLSTPTYIWEPQNGKGEWISIKVLLDLAEFEGDFGRLDVYKNGILLTSTHHPKLTKPYRSAPTPPSIINYSTSGNFIDQGTVLGWANGDTGFREKTIFLIDDFYIKANTTHKNIDWMPVEFREPSPPQTLRIE